MNEIEQWVARMNGVVAAANDGHLFAPNGCPLGVDVNFSTTVRNNGKGHVHVPWCNIRVALNRTTTFETCKPTFAEAAADIESQLGQFAIETARISAAVAAAGGAMGNYNEAQ